MVGLRLLCSAIPFTAIYLLTKFHLNANRSFKAIRQTRYRTDGQTVKAATMWFPFGEHKNQCLGEDSNQNKKGPVLSVL